MTSYKNGNKTAEIRSSAKRRKSSEVGEVTLRHPGSGEKRKNVIGSQDWIRKFADFAREKSHRGQE